VLQFQKWDLHKYKSVAAQKANETAEAQNLVSDSAKSSKFAASQEAFQRSLGQSGKASVLTSARRLVP